MTATWNGTTNWLPYERLVEDALLRSISRNDGESLLVLQPFGWHLNGTHVPNMAEHFEREWVCKELGYEVVCDFGPYIAIVRKLQVPPANTEAVE